MFFKILRKEETFLSSQQLQCLASEVILVGNISRSG